MDLGESLERSALEGSPNRNSEIKHILAVSCFKFHAGGAGGTVVVHLSLITVTGFHSGSV